MYELRFVTVADGGEHVVVSSPDLDDEEFALPITDELRDAVAAPARPQRPGPLPDEPLTPREIQSRIRAGEAPADLARASGVPVTKIDRFAGPVLAERAHIAGEARKARLSWPGGEPEPGTLGDVVTARLEAEGVPADAIEWDSWRHDDGIWIVQVAYPSDGERHTAEWSWHPGRRQLRPYGAAARALSTSAPAVPTPEPEPRATVVGLRMVPARPAPAASPAAVPVLPAAGPVASPAPLPQAARPADDGQVAGQTAIEVSGPVERPAAEAAAAEQPQVATAGGGRAPAAGDAPRAKDARGRRSRGKSRDEGEASGRRASVPSWDDIMFGVKREN